MISVIVPLHTRKQFYIQALRSLSFQTIGSEQFEVIIVSNIPVDVAEFSLNSSVVQTDDATMAGKLILGIDSARGEIISFLEDDDLFLPHKLEEVARAFKNGITFYKNGSIRFSSCDYPSEQMNLMKYEIPNIRIIMEGIWFMQ